ncbi:membrane dipeptidase [Nannocystis punicea]|uniref:Membrane dipeptidase n=1 Tax=Nannocystis punicea TaxID=2995304 RepID=A0ABY7GUW4_9BACT|nr:membrane dipeptidase [Nannocystis poenicansa]WAS90741.1 membrane dipeptidase [Nannocystis poenicansa]
MANVTRFGFVPLTLLVHIACATDPAANDEAGDTQDTTTGTDTSETGGTVPTTSVSGTVSETGETTGEPPMLDTYKFAGGCYSLRSGDAYLAASGDSFSFAADKAGAARFTMRAADLGTYLFYDQDGGYLVADSGPLVRQTVLESDVTLIDDAYVSGAEWTLETSVVDWSQYQLRNRRNDLLLGTDALADQGVPVTFEPADGCKQYPELTLDASGQIAQTMFDDGDLYGIVDTHSHIHSNYAFGGGGLFHGGAYHRLGVEHALPDCSISHGEMGRKDFFGYIFDASGNEDADLASLLPDLVAKQLSEDNHATAGYPDFTEWPNGPRRSTHQTQYWLWLQRAYLAGLRLVVQHATTNAIICDFMIGEGIQKSRYGCDDMTAVDRIIDETYAMERYIDAQSGGPGLGWFRVVHTPAEAREVIAGGKLAVILGIETSNLFDCKLTPHDGDPTCDEAYVEAQLDHYYDLGVRAVFPVHKYDNKFSPGDGDRAFIELGNFANSGHWSNFTLDCPEPQVGGFDSGNVNFGGLNMPRDVYDSPAPIDNSKFPTAPLTTTGMYLGQITEPALEGPYCQNATLTPLGEHVLDEMMARGMIIEVDHLPQWSYVRAYELLQAANYPASGSHGRNNSGLLYELGGVSASSLGVCRGDAPGATVEGFKQKIQFIMDNGGYPAEGFGFDLNGFAGARGPRFGDGVCPTPQTDPVTYPFSSFAGDIEFTPPVVGNRELDFNTEGLAHIGLLPELIEDARRDAVDEADLEPLFRSAEGYIRMWELAEARAAELGR